MITAGSYEGESFTVQRDGSYKRLVTADGVLKGVIMVAGDVSRAGTYTDLIRKKKPLSEIDFDLIRESPQLIGVSPKGPQGTAGRRSVMTKLDAKNMPAKELCARIRESTDTALAVGARGRPALYCGGPWKRKS